MSTGESKRTVSSKPLFEVHVTQVHHAIEVPRPLLTWLDCGGMEPNGFPPDGSDPTNVAACDRRCKVNDARAERICQQLEAIDGISHLEYNGHFGPYVFFACEPADTNRVVAGVRRILRKVYGQMTRSSDYKHWCAKNGHEHVADPTT